MRNRIGIAFALAVSVLSACAAKYQAPLSTLAPPQTVPAIGTTDAAVEVAWWRRFEDPALDALTAKAIEANRDLRAAASRHQAAVEYAGAAAWSQMPRGSAAAGVSARQMSESEAVAGMPDRRVTLVDAGLGLAWEADVFGRLRGMRRAAAADAVAAHMAARGVQVAIVAQVASAYFEYRGAEREAALIATLQQRTRQQLDTTRALVVAGRSTRLDLLRAQQVEEELDVAAAASAHQAERARYRIATLVGEPAGTLTIEPSPASALRAQSLPIGTPAELLQRRPDLAAAEARVTAAAARAGIARAELFPRVEVVGAIGLIAGSVGRLPEAAAGSWLIAPRLVWNVLDWPRLRRQMRAAGALADAAFAEYEQTVLRAFEETQTALDRYGVANRELSAQMRRAAAASAAAGVVLIQYREGLVDSLSHTVADRDAIAGALDANRALTAQRLAVVDLYRALGGGWR